MSEAAPVLPLRRPKRRKGAGEGRYHYTRVKPGCPCARCNRLRERARDLRGVIAVYETRLGQMRRDLWEIER